ncbi:MAG: winged helix-turn-helix transcriptional regulator [Alkalispirochaeta sp.]
MEDAIASPDQPDQPDQLNDTPQGQPDLRDLDVLAHLHAVEHPRVSQRSIANALGMSLGLTNAILRRLMDKGFLLARRINHNNVHYLVTPAGIDQISRRSYLYLRRTIGHVVRYKEHLRTFCRSQHDAGIREIILVGPSDLTFILEWCADKEGLTFQHIMDIEPARMHGRAGSEASDQAGSLMIEPNTGKGHPNRGATLIVLSENIPETEVPGAVLLHQVVLGLTDSENFRETN